MILGGVLSSDVSDTKYHSLPNAADIAIVNHVSLGMKSVSELIFREHGLHHLKVMKLSGIPVLDHDTTDQARPCLTKTPRHSRN